MRNKKRFAALALATVLAVSQVTAVAPTSAVVAEESEAETDDGSEAEAGDGSEDETEAAAETETDDSSEEETDAAAEAETDGASEEETGEGTDNDNSGTSADGTVAGVTSDGNSAEGTEGEETETEESTESQTEEGTGSEDAEDEDGPEVSEINYWFNCEWLDATSVTLNGETIRLYISSIEWQVIWDDGSEDYTEITDFTIEPFTTGRYTALEVEDAEDGGYILSFTGIREGGTDTVIIAGYDSDGDYVVEQEFGIGVSEEYYILSYDNGSIPTDAFRIGDTYSLANEDFTLTRYYTDEDGSSQSETVEIDGETYWLELEEGSIDTNSLAIQYAEDGSIDSLLRKVNWDTNFWVQVWYANENGEDDWLSDTCVYVDSYDISKEISKTYGTEDDEYYYYVFAGNPQTLTLNFSEDVSFPEGSAIVWDVYPYDEISGYVSWTDHGDGSITFTVDEELPDEYREGYRIDFSYYLRYEDGTEVYLGEDSLEVLKTYYDYDEFGDVTMLNDWWWDIGSTLGCSYRDMAHPFGDWTEVTITNVSMEQYSWDDTLLSEEEAILEISGSTEDGWTIAATGGDSGYALVTISHETMEGDEDSSGTKQCYVTVTNEYYDLQWEYSTGTGTMLAGEEQTIDSLTLFCAYMTPVEDYYEYSDEYITDFVNSGYTLSVMNDEGELTYDDSIISVSLDDGIVTITSLEEGWTSICLRALDADGNEVASTNIDIEVTDFYYQLTGSVENVGLGESLDVENAGWVLTRNYTNEDGEAVREDVSEEEYTLYFSEIDTDFWGLDDEGWGELLTTTFVRNDTYDTSFRVYAVIEYEDGSTEDVADYRPYFPSIDYGAYIEITYGEEYASYLYMGEPATITLIPYGSNEYEYPDGCEVFWTVEQWNMED